MSDNENKPMLNDPKRAITRASAVAESTELQNVTTEDLLPAAPAFEEAELHAAPAVEALIDDVVEAAPSAAEPFTADVEGIDELLSLDDKSLEFETDRVEPAKQVFMGDLDDLDFHGDEATLEPTEEPLKQPAAFVPTELDISSDDIEVTEYTIAGDFDMSKRVVLTLGERLETPDLDTVLSGFSQEDYEDTFKKLESIYPNWQKADEGGNPVDPEGFLVMCSIIKNSSTMTLAANPQIGELRNFVVDANGRMIAPSRYRPVLGKGTLEGPAAAMNISTTLDSVIRHRVMLGNSGFTIELSNFTGTDITFLDLKLATNLGELGRSTAGSARLHTTNYLTRDIVNFIIEHMTGHNVEDVAQTDKTTIRSLIDAADIETLIIGASAATKPDGGTIAVACANPKVKEDKTPVCNAHHVGTIMYSRSIWVDHGKLTDYQKEIITRGFSKKVTKEELKKYREDFKTQDPLVIENNSYRYEFILGRRMLDPYLQDGSNYCNGITKVIEKHLGNRTDVATRNQITIRLLNENILSMYYSVVSQIKITAKGTENVTMVEDNATIVNVLKQLNNHPDYERLLRGLTEYTMENPVVIAADAPVCPTCGYKSKNDLVTFNPLTSFFTQVLSKEVALLYIATPT